MAAAVAETAERSFIAAETFLLTEGCEISGRSNTGKSKGRAVDLTEARAGGAGERWIEAGRTGERDTEAWEGDTDPGEWDTEGWTAGDCGTESAVLEDDADLCPNLGMRSVGKLGLVTEGETGDIAFC